MSVKVMADVFLMKNLPPREKLVLLAYADHAHDDGTHVYPAIDSIAKKVSMSYRTVLRATQQLEKWGLMVRDGKQQGGVIAWRIDTSKASELPSVNLADVTPVSQGYDTRVIGGVTPVADKPLINHQLTTRDVVVVAARKDPECLGVYAENIGEVTPLMLDILRKAEGEYTPAWVHDSITVAAKNNKQTWRYCEGILKNWKRDGRKSRRGKVVQDEDARQRSVEDKIRKYLGAA